MSNTSKNTLLVATALLAVASLIAAFVHVPNQQPAANNQTKGVISFEKATEIKSTVESLKTDAEKIAYLNSQFQGKKANSSLVSLNTSSASAPDWCAYANYYLDRIMALEGTGNTDLVNAYVEAYYSMLNHAAEELGRTCSYGSDM
jgi:hypothetical protein